ETVRNIKPPLAYWHASERGKYIRYLKVWKIEAKPNVIERKKPFFDMEIHVEKEVFKVHRMIVACFMPYLMQRLAKMKADGLQKRVCKLNLKNIESGTKHFKYMDTESVDPTGENFITFLESALRLYMDSFADIWIDAYEYKLGSRVLQLLFRLRLARKYGWTDYISQLNIVIALGFENLVLSDKFVQLKFEELHDFLKKTKSECKIILLALKWLNHDWKTRKKFAVPLMSEICFAYITDDEHFVCYNPPILIEEIKSMTAEALHLQKKHLTQTLNRAVDANVTQNIEVRTNAKRKLQNPYKLIIVVIKLSISKKSATSKETSDLSMKLIPIESSFKLPSSESSFEIFSESERKEEYTEIDEILKYNIKTPSPPSHSASAVFHSDNVYVIGGRILSSSNTLKMSDKVFRFSPFGKKWEEICLLKKARCNIFAFSYVKYTHSVVAAIEMRVEDCESLDTNALDKEACRS
ncbi:ring canal kelch-like protein, partial [Dinothrombium tinctorium]